MSQNIILGKVVFDLVENNSYIKFYILEVLLLSSLQIIVYIHIVLCSSCHDFRNRVLLLNLGFLFVKSSIWKFYGRHLDLINRFRMSVSQMTTDVFHLSWELTGPFLIQDLSPAL